MTRSPWFWFLLVGLVPALLLSGNMFGGSVALAALLPALAAMLVISSGDEPRPLPEHLTKRLLVAVGVVVPIVGARLVWTGAGGLAYALLVAGVPAALAAWVLSGVYAPSPAVRRWVRSLVATGAPRRVLLVAILAWPLVAATSVAVGAAVPGLSLTAPRGASTGLLLSLTVTGVFSAALAALAWYGFAAVRLLPRLGPLATGLLIGAVQWLVVWGLDVWPFALPASFLLVRLAGSVAAALTAVWALERSRGSLLPVWLLAATLAVAQPLSRLTVIPDDVTRTGTMQELFVTGQVILALVLVVACRMWRRSPGTTTSEPTRSLAESELESS